MSFYRCEEAAHRRSICTMVTTMRAINTCSSETAFSVVPGTQHWTDQQWAQVLFTDESRFSLISDSGQIRIQRERKTRNHTPLSSSEGIRMAVAVFSFGQQNAWQLYGSTYLPRRFNHWRTVLYRDFPYMRLLRGSMSPQFLFMDENTPPHRTEATSDLLESGDIECLN